MDINKDIANVLLTGFKRHYSIFLESTEDALQALKNHQWKAIQRIAQQRIDFYEIRARETKELIISNFPVGALNTNDWSEIKRNYIRLLLDIKQPELAETFFNTVVCRLLDRKYYNNQFIFFRPMLSTEFLVAEKPAYFSYEVTQKNLLSITRELLKEISFDGCIGSIKKEIRKLLKFLRDIDNSKSPNRAIKIDVLSSLFIRNKGAYIIARLVDKERYFPLVLALTPDKNKKFKIDAILHKQEQLVTLFSFSRSYFFVNTEIPAAFVSFIKSLMPNKPTAEIYSSVGLHKHGKTLFYRTLFDHLFHSNDKFIEARGIAGLVMIVLTLPSFPYVFKIIRDRFGQVKDITRDEVKDKYLLVKKHDRVGRLADTMEFKDVAIPRDRFSVAIINMLLKDASQSVTEDENNIIFKHVYIERRMLPLNIHVDNNPSKSSEKEVIDYGQAVKDLAAANIFPGDLLLKNFGITNYGKVVFYDYDEITLLSECKFSKVPQARTLEEEMASEPWYPVGKNDVYPETWEPFLVRKPELKRILKKHHGQIFDPEYWKTIQSTIAEGEVHDVFPYDDKARLEK